MDCYYSEFESLSIFFGFFIFLFVLVVVQRGFVTGPVLLAIFALIILFFSLGITFPQVIILELLLVSCCRVLLYNR